MYVVCTDYLLAGWWVWSSLAIVVDRSQSGSFIHLYILNSIFLLLLCCYLCKRVVNVTICRMLP